MKIGRHTIDLSNTDKVLFPDAGITKGDLIDYYRDMADRMLPYLKGRPVTLHRFPDGIGTDGFYQKSRSDYFPAWIESVSMAKEGGAVEMVVIEDTATLVYLANQACIEPHIWLSRADRPDTPDRIIFDLDPPEGKFDSVVKAARTLRGLLEDRLGIMAFPMLTGSKGIHVVVPLRREKQFDHVRSVAKAIAERLADEHPEELTTEVRKEKRKGRVFLDYLRNAYAQTGIAPYGVRARAGAPVAVPLGWDELGRVDRSDAYTIQTIRKRLASFDDPWRGMNRHAVSIGTIEERLDSLDPVG